MEMTRFEKFFVNRERKGSGNYARVQRALARVDSSSIRDVLEIGCGIGTVSARMSEESGWNVTGSDFDAAQIEEAKRRYPESLRLRYLREDATRLSFADASVDLVVAQMVFHHIPAWPVAASEIARVLRPGGIAYWCDLVVAGGLVPVLRPLAQFFGVCSSGSVDAAFASAGMDVLHSGRAAMFGISLDERILKKRQDWEK